MWHTYKNVVSEGRGKKNTLKLWWRVAGGGSWEKAQALGGWCPRRLCPENALPTACHKHKALCRPLSLPLNMICYVYTIATTQALCFIVSGTRKQFKLFQILEGSQSGKWSHLLPSNEVFIITASIAQHKVNLSNFALFIHHNNTSNTDTYSYVLPCPHNLPNTNHLCDVALPTYGTSPNAEPSA